MKKVSKIVQGAFSVSLILVGAISVVTKIPIDPVFGGLSMICAGAGLGLLLIE